MRTKIAQLGRRVIAFGPEAIKSSGIILSYGHAKVLYAAIKTDEQHYIAMDDPKNIAGISALLADNEDEMESLTQLEREIIDGAPADDADQNIAAEFERDMARLTQNFQLPAERAATPPAQTPKAQQPSLQRWSTRSPAPASTARSPASASAPAPARWRSQDPHLQRVTVEEQKQEHIQKVLDNFDEEPEFDLDKERDENEKMMLLEQIDMLRSTLEDDGVDCSAMPVPTSQSTLREMRDLYQILHLKNDRSRCYSLANEVILAGAKGMETIFNGENTIFGFTPDLTNWSDTVKIKLRRMRYETSTLVQSIMQGYQIGPGWRLLLEIVPSLFIYSRNRRKLPQNRSVADDYNFQLNRDTASAMSSLNK